MGTPLQGLTASDFAAKSSPIVEHIFGTTIDLPEFRKKLSNLTRADRLCLVEQARLLLQQNYAHLPLKKSMHGIDPVQKLALLEHALRYAPDDDLSDELAFHLEMLEIFTSVRDLHTNYFLPKPFKGMTAFLPFLVEEFVEDGQLRYLVTKLSDGFSSPPFEPGVEVISWSGIPVARAVQIQGDRYAGSNMEARRARGVATLTVRPLKRALPPDEDFVIVGFRTSDGARHELRVNWLVFAEPEAAGELAPPEPSNANLEAAAAQGIDAELDAINRAKKFLFAPRAVADEFELGRTLSSDDVAMGVSDEKNAWEPRPADFVPDSVIGGRTVETPSGVYGYIRIRTFLFEMVGDTEADDYYPKMAEAMLDKFLQLAERLPQDGLIIDVRGNGGGLIWVGERLLQFLTPKRIEPEPTQFINTPLNLRICTRKDFLSPWVDSIRQSFRTGATFSRGFPITDTQSTNSIGQRYHGPVVLVTDALCYSTTDFFAAGFQDHNIGPILGVHSNTGAGGANVWTHDLLQKFYPPETDGSPYVELPQGANFRVSMRRSLRVGSSAGIPVEDLGIVPDETHDVTKADLLEQNVDLINRAAKILSGMTRRRLDADLLEIADGRLKLVVGTVGVTRLDVFVDGRPQLSIDVDGAKNEFEVAGTPDSIIDLSGYESGELVAGRRLAVA